MPTVSGNGVQLYWEAAGEGPPLVWVREYGGDLRSWEPQARYFSRRYRVITYNQRGYPSSTVPTSARDKTTTSPCGRPLGFRRAFHL
jgi:pimeloyl-ACP methyl ester carboxylesterase